MKKTVSLLLAFALIASLFVPAFAADNIAVSATYGEVLGEISLPDGYEWEDSAATDVGSVGVNTFDAFCVSDSGAVERVKVSVMVAPASFSDIVVDTDGKEFYTGEPVEPNVTIYFDDEKLVKDIDYTVTYENNINIGSARIVIKGIGNFQGKSVVDFNIVKVNVTSVSLSETEISLEPGAARQLDVTVNPKNATVKDVKWESLDNSVAMVDQNGLVTAMGNGSTYIRVASKDGNFEAYCVVNVSVGVASINIIEEYVYVRPLSPYTLNADIYPTTASNTKIFWYSSDESVAVVDSKGKVKAVGKGETTITAMTEDGKLMDSCVVCVDQTLFEMILAFIFGLFGA